MEKKLVQYFLLVWMLVFGISTNLGSSSLSTTILSSSVQSDLVSKNQLTLRNNSSDFFISESIQNKELSIEATEIEEEEEEGGVGEASKKYFETSVYFFNSQSIPRSRIIANHTVKSEGFFQDFIVACAPEISIAYQVFTI